LKSASLQYANALADIALEQGAGEPAAKQLESFGAAYAQSAELRTFLGSPAVSVEAKHEVLEKIAKRLGASKIIRNFLLVIADNRRTQLIPEIAAAFQQVLRQRQGVAEAEILSAAELTGAQKKELAATLERLTGKKSARFCASRLRITSRPLRSTRWARSSAWATALRACTALKR